MSNLKDTDFDDLFRRASDKYPLRTDRADWNKMAAALDGNPAPAGFDGTETDDKRRKRRFFWLLLLLPLGGAGYYTWNHAGHGVPHPGVDVVAGKGGRQDGSTVAGKGGPQDGSTVAGKGGRQDGSTVAGKGGRQDGSTRSGNAVGSDPRVKDGLENAAGGGSPVKDGSTVSGKTAGTGGQLQIKERSTGLENADRDVVKGRDRSTKPYIQARPFTLEWAGDMQRAPIAGDFNLSVDVTAPPAAKDPDPAKPDPAKPKDPESAKSKNTDSAKPKRPKTSYWYAGISGAPDISTVKMQSVKGVGTTFGVLLGYAFNPRWSIETGAYIDRKKYYTDGEYFNKEDLPQYNINLLNVNGTCFMWEIPLNVRYTFNPKAKLKWFATGGLSTYLMSKENYTYAYERNNWYGQSSLNINKPSRYPFSIVNLSAGFEQSLGRVGSLRVEPYVRLPLEGIGTGKLPIMSAGVNIGITRRLW